MGFAFHQLCPRYSGTLPPLPLRLFGYGKLLPFLTFLSVSGLLFSLVIFLLIPKDKSSVWSNFVLQSLKHFIAHMIKILILRQRNLSKQLFAQISLSQY